MDIRIDDLSGPDVARLLEEHLEEMRSVSPPQSTHALDLEGLRLPEITFWTAWKSGKLAACGAIKRLDKKHAEIKSMRTSAEFRQQGIASVMLEHILEEARQRGYQRLSLETGSMDYFRPARSLYRSFGFDYCRPFADYRLDPNSVYMSREI